MADRVFLHVGTPKSGTTYLQALIWKNADLLAANGLLLPGEFQTHYAAAKGVTSRTGQLRQTKIAIDRAWPTLCNQIANWPSSALVSHELLAPATTSQADAAKRLLDGAQIDLVLTARALPRQLPASWQEQVKGGLPTPYPTFVQRVHDVQERGAWFWEVQDLVAIASNWGHDLQPERIHIVTVPLNRADPTLLWRRYVSVFGLEPADYSMDAPIKNISLGVVESELLRLVHAVRDERFTDPKRHKWTRKLLATEILGRRPGGQRMRLPDDSASWLAERSAEMSQAILSAGYDVVGDLDELTTHEPDADARTVESVTEEELNAAASWTISRLQEVLVHKRSHAKPPPVGPDSGVFGILELLEHIRAADTGAEPRPAPPIERSFRLRRPLGLRRPK